MSDQINKPYSIMAGAGLEKGRLMDGCPQAQLPPAGLRRRSRGPGDTLRFPPRIQPCMQKLIPQRAGRVVSV